MKLLLTQIFFFYNVKDPNKNNLYIEGFTLIK
jgi:hypothetical protein